MHIIVDYGKRTWVLTFSAWAAGSHRSALLTISHFFFRREVEAKRPWENSAWTMRTKQTSSPGPKRSAPVTPPIPVPLGWARGGKGALRGTHVERRVSDLQSTHGLSPLAISPPELVHRFSRPVALPVNLRDLGLL
jgi:hypothetical protein